MIVIQNTTADWMIQTPIQFILSCHVPRAIYVAPSCTWNNLPNVNAANISRSPYIPSPLPIVGFSTKKGGL